MIEEFVTIQKKKYYCKSDISSPTFLIKKQCTLQKTFALQFAQFFNTNTTKINFFFNKPCSLTFYWRCPTFRNLLPPLLLLDLFSVDTECKKIQSWSSLLDSISRQVGWQTKVALLIKSQAISSYKYNKTIPSPGDGFSCLVLFFMIKGIFRVWYLKSSLSILRVYNYLSFISSL